jgi:hypothetical protein
MDGENIYESNLPQNGIIVKRNVSKEIEAM